MKKFLLLCLTSLLLVTGCTMDAPQKKYSSNGFTITMDEGFHKKSLLSATVYLEKTDAIMTALKEEYETLESAGITEDSTISDYAEAVLENNQATSDKVYDGTTSNYKYFTYEKSANGKTFFYTSVVVKSKDAFWLINFACEKADKSIYSEKFLSWAETIKV